MKIPLSKDEDCKGIMMSGSSTGRKELIHELRETSLIGGNAVPNENMVDIGVQFKGNIDLGSGDTTDLYFGKENKSTETRNSTLAVVEEESKHNHHHHHHHQQQHPKLRANESNPTVPSHKEPSKTSTLRLSDRQRSESEDDIENADDPEQDGAVFDRKELYQSKVIVEDSTQNSEKMDKNGNKSDGDQNEVENDCIVQCLYYTIQCCECVTF